MNTLLRNGILVLSLVGLMSVAVPATPALAVDKSCDSHLLTFPAWYNGLVSKEGNKCVVDAPQSDVDGKQIRVFISKLLLNIVDILMQLVAYASIVYLMIGGFKYLTSSGLSEQMAAGKKTILNAIIGLIIAILAVAIVNLVGASLS